jgi:hypothetical protein
VPRGEARGDSSGVWAPTGSWLLTCCRRSVTDCRAWAISASWSNTTCTIDSPTFEEERTVVTPGKPFTALSMGTVIWVSTSSGARPGASV